MMNDSLLLIAGIPATGKSHFGQWLSRKHGYVHIDVEKPDRLSLGLDATWNTILQPGGVSRFLAALRALRHHVALDWGFPPELLHVVREMRSEGLDIWWFDGDRARAREEFVKRGTGAVSDLNVQMTNIDSQWVGIRDLFGPNRIDVLASSGQRLSPEEIWTRIAASSA